MAESELNIGVTIGTSKVQLGVLEKSFKKLGKVGSKATEELREATDKLKAEVADLQKKTESATDALVEKITEDERAGAVTEELVKEYKKSVAELRAAQSALNAEARSREKSNAELEKTVRLKKEENALRLKRGGEAREKTFVGAKGLAVREGLGAQDLSVGRAESLAIQEKLNAQRIANANREIKDKKLHGEKIKQITTQNRQEILDIENKFDRENDRRRGAQATKDKKAKKDQSDATKRLNDERQKEIDVTRRKIAGDKQLASSDEKIIRAIRERLRAGERLTASERDLIRQVKIKIAQNRKLSASEAKLAAAISTTTTALKVNKSWMGKMVLASGSMRRQLASLRNSFLVWAFAIGMVVAPFVAMIRKAAELEKGMKALDIVGRRLGLGMGATRQAAMELTKDGLLNVAQASLGLSRLLATGIGLDKATQLLKAFKDAAVFGGQGTKSLNENLIVAIDGFRNFQSRALDNIGITKNASVIIAEYGLSINKTTGQMSELEKHLALANGLIKEAELFSGSALLASRTLSGQTERLGNAWALLSAAIGQTTGARGTVGGLADAFFFLADGIEEFGKSDSEKVLSWMQRMGKDWEAEARILGIRLELKKLVEDVGKRGFWEDFTKTDFSNVDVEQAIADQKAFGQRARDLEKRSLDVGGDPAELRDRLAEEGRIRGEALRKRLKEEQRINAEAVDRIQDYADWGGFDRENRAATSVRPVRGPQGTVMRPGHPGVDLTGSERLARIAEEQAKALEGNSDLIALLNKQIAETDLFTSQATQRLVKLQNEADDLAKTRRQALSDSEKALLLAKKKLDVAKETMRQAKSNASALASGFEGENKDQADVDAAILANQQTVEAASATYVKALNKVALAETRLLAARTVLGKKTSVTTESIDAALTAKMNAAQRDRHDYLLRNEEVYNSEYKRILNERLTALRQFESAKLSLVRQGFDNELSNLRQQAKDAAPEYLPARLQRAVEAKTAFQKSPQMVAIEGERVAAIKSINEQAATRKAATQEQLGDQIVATRKSEELRQKDSNAENKLLQKRMDKLGNTEAGIDAMAAQGEFDKLDAIHAQYDTEQRLIRQKAKAIRDQAAEDERLRAVAIASVNRDAEQKRTTAEGQQDFGGVAAGPGEHARILAEIQEVAVADLKRINDHYNNEKALIEKSTSDRETKTSKLASNEINRNKALERSKKKTSDADRDAQASIAATEKKASDATLTGWAKIEGLKKRLARLRGEEIQQDIGSEALLAKFVQGLRDKQVEQAVINQQTDELKQLWIDINKEQDDAAEARARSKTVAEAKRAASAWVSAFGKIEHAADEAGNKTVEKWARVGQDLANIAQQIQTMRSLAEAGGAAGMLGPVGAALGIGVSIYSMVQASKSKDKMKGKRGMDVGGTISRGPQTVNINPTIVNTVDTGMVVYSSDGLEAVKATLIDMVQESVDRGEISGMN